MHVYLYIFRSDVICMQVIFNCCKKDNRFFMRTASVVRIAEGWRVLCRNDSELLHTLYFYDSDFSDMYDSFSFALSRAEIWFLTGFPVPFEGVRK